MKANAQCVSEDIMQTPGGQNGRVQTGTTGWISIQINNSGELPIHAQDQVKSIPPDLIHLFEHSASAPISVSERFPRLTFMAIAIALLVTAVTAEFDYLRGAGYFWP